MSITRHQHIFKTLTLAYQHMKQLFYGSSNLLNLRTREKFQIEQHLIVTRTTTMYLLTYITQFTRQHQFHLRVYIFHSFFYHKLPFLGSRIDIFQFFKQKSQLFLRQQTNTFEHGDVSHRTYHIMFSQIKVHLAITSHREAFYILIYLNGFLPKFLSHLFSD